MSRNKWLKVSMGGRRVGTLAAAHRYLAAFEYDRDWLEDGFSISPLQLTMRLTGDYQELEKLYRLMCFNVFAHNRDDHSKNFSYVYEQGRWQLSPAYDLTYSSSIGGEHATMVNGNGSDPGMKDLLAENIAKQVREIVRAEQWYF